MINSEFNLNKLSAGRFVEACYQESLVPAYQGNPLIECLPPILAPGEAYLKLREIPPFDETMRNHRSEIRIHHILNADDFLQPDSRHLDLERKISVAIRKGYKQRNPMDLFFEKDHKTRVKTSFTTALEKNFKLFTNSIAIAGISGGGKSWGIFSVLQLYPQVIIHETYNGKAFPFWQIVWLYIHCPHDGSVKSMCLSILQAIDYLLDTTYHDDHNKKNVTANELIAFVKNLTGRLGIGCIVIDEFQNLSVAKSRGDEATLNFLRELVNVLMVPVVFVGTYSLIKLFRKTFQLSRREDGEGELIWKRFENDEEWKLFLATLWKYQYTKIPVPLTVEMSNLIYEESQGITDIAVKLFLGAQVRAIINETEEITPEIILSIAASNFVFTQEALTLLKAQNWQELDDKYPDIGSVDSEMYYNKLLNKRKIQDMKIIQQIESNHVQIKKTSKDSNKKNGTNSPDLRKISEISNNKPLNAYEKANQAGILKDSSEFYEGEIS